MSHPPVLRRASGRFGAFVAAAACVLLGVVSLPGAARASVTTPSRSLVISAVFSSGGNAGSYYANDFVEIFNAGPTPQSLAGLSIQSGHSDGTLPYASVAALNAVTLQPGQTYLLAGSNNGTGSQVALPIAADQSHADLRFVQAAGSVFLVDGTAPLASATDPAIIDLVGYGNAASGTNRSSYFLGTPAGTLGVTTAAFRTDRCINTNNNGADYTVQPVLSAALHNTSSALTPCAAPALVVSGVYAGGGNDGSYYANDLVELFNAGTSPQSLGGLSVQFGSSAGQLDYTTVVALSSVTLQPGQHYLLAMSNNGGGSQQPLVPAPDQTDTSFHMVQGAGSIFLVNGTARVTSGDDSRIIDLVGYGDAASGSDRAGFFLGAPAPTLSAVDGDFRTDPCADTRNNAADFTRRSAQSATLHNTASPLTPCAAAPAPRDVVVTTIYGHGGNDGSYYTHDFVELFNPTATPQRLAGLSIQWGGFSALPTSSVALNDVTLQPGQYYFVRLSGSGLGSQIALPVTPDQVAGSYNLQSQGGLFLVDGTAPATGVDDPRIVDLVGYGASNTLYRGSPIGTTSLTTVAHRNDPCVNTDDNGHDFSLTAVQTVALHDSTDAPAPCGTTNPPATTVPPATTTTTTLPAGPSDLTFAFIGDVPYGAAELAEFPSLSRAINRDPDVAFVAHSGDIKDGSTTCSDEMFQTIFDGYQGFDDPFWYTPGDNEWTDCHRATGGPFYPLERLAKIRSLFFPVPGQTTGGTTMQVTTQASSADPAYQPYVENTMFTRSCVTFGDVHVVGSSDDGAAWTNLPGGDLPVERTAEYTARRAAAVAWIDEVFDQAIANDSKAVWLMMQAEPTTASAFSAVRAKVLQRAASFDGVVWLAHGDEHVYRYTPGYAGVANLTRLENPGATAVEQWLKIEVRCDTPGVFTQTLMHVSDSPDPTVPEGRLAVLLSLSAVVLLGGLVMVRTRRRLPA